MSLDLSKMSEITEKLYLTSIVKAYGNSGVEALREIMAAIKSLYRFLEPDLIKGVMLVFRTMDDKVPNYLNEPEFFSSPEFLAQGYDYASSKRIALIQVRHNGELLLWKHYPIDPSKLSEDAIVYLYENRSEYFYVKGQKKSIYNPSKAHTSVFSVPTFRELKDALEDYKWRMIRTSKCKIFSNAWYRGAQNNRLFFQSKPESIMRNSLIQYLAIVLRDTEVRPEQNVDESHPIDIKITWMLTYRIALIEIKWLGKSLNENGKMTTNYSAWRAKQGAKQLAGYLDSNRGQVPTHQTIGYLVVIDARRRGLNELSISVNYVDGLFYKNAEVKYNPEYHKIRNNFERPIRMFVEPICEQN